MSLAETQKKIQEKSISIEIFGLGYVGFPLTVRLASGGFKVIGIDVNHERVERLNNNELMDSAYYIQSRFI